MSSTAAADDALETAPIAVGIESWTALAAWAADELGVRLVFDGDVYRIEEVADDQPTDPSASESTIRRGWFRRRSPTTSPADQDDAAPEPFIAATPADVVAALIARLGDRDEPTHARPVTQPDAVHELSARLFDAYTLDGGQAHLAGCHFEAVPLVRYTRVEDDDDSPTVTHRFFDELGEVIDWPQVELLGIDHVAPLNESAPRLEEGRLARMLGSARHAAGGEEPTLVTIVWAKRAWGRLRFEFGDESVDAVFDGWARTLTAPPVVCPQTGVETFHLTTIEDGTLAAAEQVARCAVTGHRHLVRDLVRCAATGKLAEADFFDACAATGDRVLTTKLVRCDRCGLKVSPSVINPGDCDACHVMKRVSPDNRELKLALMKRPVFSSGKWMVAETPTAYILESTGWLRRRVLTLDRKTYAVLHAAEAARFSSTWRTLPTDSFDT